MELNPNVTIAEGENIAQTEFASKNQFNQPSFQPTYLNDSQINNNFSILVNDNPTNTNSKINEIQINNNFNSSLNTNNNGINISTNSKQSAIAEN